MRTVSKNRRLVLIAIFAAVAMVLMVFPVIPMFGGFMKLDFSIVVVLIGMYLLDFSGAVTILLLRSLLKVIIFNNGVSDWIGMPMNIVAMTTFIGIIWLFTKNNGFDVKQYLMGSVFGTIAMTVMMTLLNWVYAIPLYQKFANFSLASVGLNMKAWLVSMVIPFNLVQGIVLTIVSALVIVALRHFIEQQQVSLKK